MQYKNVELEEITEPQVFNPPKEMLVWNDAWNGPEERSVCAIIKLGDCFQAIGPTCRYQHCAEIPEPKSRRATNRELARWLAKGNGQISRVEDGVILTSSSWDYYSADDSFVQEESRIRIRKWDDAEWHAPTADYMGLGE